MFGRRRRSGTPTPRGKGGKAARYHDLRRMALGAVEHGLAAPSADHPDVSGVVVDIPGDGGFATVVAMTDNTTSMYTSTGGGTIGAGEFAHVAAATQQLLVELQRELELFEREASDELPPPGRVRIHVLSPSGTRRADVAENAFWGGERDPLTSVIVKVQDVLSAIRSTSTESR